MVVVVGLQNPSKERHPVPREIVCGPIDWKRIDNDGETIGAKLLRINLGFSPISGSNESRINIITSTTMAIRNLALRPLPPPMEKM